MTLNQRSRQKETKYNINEIEPEIKDKKRPKKNINEIKPKSRQKISKKILIKSEIKIENDQENINETKLEVKDKKY